MKISVIIPALNEAENIVTTLEPLQSLRKRQHEIILVDGGSKDNTIELAENMVDNIITATRGRASQMNAGANLAQGNVVWFIHSDSVVPEHADKLISQALTEKHWGRFNVQLSGHHVFFRIIEWMMNLRSCVTGIATGDQGIFIETKVFKNAGGFPDIALMEDIAISKQLLKNAGRPACIKSRLITSSRRWEKHGIFKTMLLMWQLRLAYFFGASPNKLAKRYSRN